ncbi:hypothetical protein LOTGIDRAFT_170654 [Lottia gigantea]|uniref:Uncharacterized protein n=1 Tax=Lottia gigantea TaxID=225164 RepID=V4CQ31_LOTGI|nr:hypothetical protein LOTGIDRAFT_170654 [Lottia gigantea]ESP04560.1 hypothetical protein LOTGIDRAFT_170654 [Lottia gigantea]
MMAGKVSSRRKSPRQPKLQESSITRIQEEEDDDDEEDNEMTLDEKKAMYNAVKVGDIDILEELLERQNADIKMLWYSENLLMASIRFEQDEMAEFLLDNGVDQNHSKLLIRNPENGVSNTEQYTYTCRQMAYDHELFDIVEIIDVMNNQLFPGVKPRRRVPRYRREKPPTPLRDLSPAPESDTSDKENKSKKPGAVRKKTKKLLKRVSADLLSLLEDSDDEQDSGKQDKELPRRGSLPPGVGNKRKGRQSKSAKSVDRDSGVYSIEPGKSLSEMDESCTSPQPRRKETNTTINFAKDTSPSPMTQRSPKPSTSKETKFKTETHEQVTKKRLNKTFKIFGNVARASRPMSAYQYVTDHSRCRTLGYKKELNPRFEDKIKCHGSYTNESFWWKPQKKTEYYHIQTRAFSAPVLCPRVQSRGCSMTSNKSYLRTNKNLMPTRKLDQQFRGSYTTLSFNSNVGLLIGI